MALVPSAFRQQYPEFTDPSIYTDTILGFWDSVALLQLNADRWGALLSQGESLFVAHHLVLAAKSKLAVDAGGQPGQVQGPINSKSIDKVAASYDSALVTLTDAGFWNMSVYGLQFLRLARMVGAGGAQLGLPC